MFEAIFKARGWEFKQQEFLAMTSTDMPQLLDDEEIKQPKVDVLWLHKM